jgi:hypothetical protein
MRRLSSSLALAHALLVSAACGGGGGGGGAPEDAIAQGTITGTGSIAVTGTLFEIDAGTEIDLDGEEGDGSALAIGMQVAVEGSHTGDTGTAHFVTFDDDLEGEVESAVAVGDDVLELEIFEQIVVIEDGVTLFQGTDFATVGAGDVLEVSGLRDGDGAIHATWVRLVADAAAPGMPVSLEGEVESLTSTGFTIGPIAIQYDEDGVTTDLQGVPEGGLVEGDFVDVQGQLVDAATVDADLGLAPDQGIVELEEPISGSRSDVQLEGIVSELASLSDFALSGQPTNAGRFGVEFEPAGLASSLADGDRIEVEGSVRDGVLVAEAVKLRAGEVRIEGAVGNPQIVVDLTAGTLLLLGATLEIDGSTRFDGFAGLGDLSVEDLLEVRGVDLGDVVRPTEMRLVGDLPVFRVRGRVEAFDGSGRRFTIVNVTIRTDPSTTYGGLFPPALDTEAELYAFLSACPNALLDVTRVPPSHSTSLEVAGAIALDDTCTP